MKSITIYGIKIDYEITGTPKPATLNCPGTGWEFNSISATRRNGEAVDLSDAVELLYDQLDIDPDFPMEGEDSREEGRLKMEIF